MDTWQPATLSWSLSRKVHFDSCRRHYYFHRFWGQDPKLRWRLFEMRNLTTLTMLRGQVVHTVIADALMAAKAGKILDAAAVKKNVTTIIRERYGESAKRLWHIDNRPQGKKLSEITSLVEHYYGFLNMNERARDAQQVAWLCVENLVGSDLWQELVSDTESWGEIDDAGFPSFDIDGIQVYAKVDFAHSNGTRTIIDWKTGAPSGDEKKQLTLYALYAQSKWNWNPKETRLMAVYLQPELTIETFTAAPEDLDAVESEVKQSFRQMMELEPAFGPADFNNFPMTGGANDCRWCRFQGICEGAKKLSQEQETPAVL